MPASEATTPFSLCRDWPEIDPAYLHRFASETTLVIPSIPGREHLVQRVLTHLHQQRAQAPILLAIDVKEEGDPAKAIDTALWPARFPGLKLEVREYPLPTPFLDKLIDATRAIATPYVQLVADDDYVFVEDSLRSAAFLKEHPPYICASGAWMFLTFPEGRANAVIDPRQPVEALNAAERIPALLQDFYHTLYCVFRREDLAHLLTIARDHTDNDYFWQLALAAATAAAGRIASFPTLHYVRELHQANWTSYRPSHVNPPGVFVSAQFSTELARLRRLLADLVREQDGTLTKGFLDNLDAAFIALLARDIDAWKRPVEAHMVGPFAEATQDPNSHAGRRLGLCCRIHQELTGAQSEGVP